MHNNETVTSLAATVRDETKPAAERYDALRLICKLKGDVYQQVPESHLRFVVAAMLPLPGIGFAGLSLRDAAEAIAEGRARGSAGETRRS